MKGLDTIKKWIGAITELFMLLIALAIVVSVLFGTNIAFFPVDVIGNLTSLVNSLGSGGLAGLIVLAIILWLFSNRKIS